MSCCVASRRRGWNVRTVGDQTRPWIVGKNWENLRIFGRSFKRSYLERICFPLRSTYLLSYLLSSLEMGLESTKHELISIIFWHFEKGRLFKWVKSGSTIFNLNLKHVVMYFLSVQQAGKLEAKNLSDDVTIKITVQSILNFANWTTFCQKSDIKYRNVRM